jgi:hypothetical protein
VRHDAHRVEQFASEKLHADDTAVRVDVEVFLKQEEVVGQPQVGTVAEETEQLVGRLEQEHARTAASLLGLEKGGPPVAPLIDRGVGVVEGEGARVGDSEPVHQRGLRGLAQLEREGA